MDNFIEEFQYLLFAESFPDDMPSWRIDVRFGMSQYDELKQNILDEITRFLARHGCPFDYSTNGIRILNE